MRLNARTMVAWVALALLAASWLHARAAGTFAAHMGAHVLAVAVVAPVIASVLPWPRWLTRPGTVLTACGIEFLVVWGWHLPGAHEAARASGALFVLEQVSFLMAGLGLWAGAWPRQAAASRHRGSLIGSAVLLLTSMHMTLLGALLILAPEPLYHEGPGALADQQLGALIMLVVCTAAYLGAALLLLGRLLRDREPRTELHP